MMESSLPENNRQKVRNYAVFNTKKQHSREGVLFSTLESVKAYNRVGVESISQLSKAYNRG